MMRIYLSFIFLISLNSFGECIQPYFPPQIVFSPNDGQTIYAIDEFNQRAYKTITLNASSRETSFAMSHFPYTIPGSPQSKYDV
jgi:hypothetical protein